MPSIYFRACSKMTNHGGNSQPGPVTCSCKRRWSQLGILLQQVIVSIYWPRGVFVDCTLTTSLGDCLRRFFAALSVGLVLNNGHGIADVTNENANQVDDLSRQEREDITGKAQIALRLIAFGVCFYRLTIFHVILVHSQASRYSEGFEGFQRRA